MFAKLMDLSLTLKTIRVAFSSQRYSFLLKLKLSYPPTACLASLIMKLWDRAWVELLDREDIQIFDHFRYVDDIRDFLRPLLHGVRWHEGHFEFREVWAQEDRESDVSDQQRTSTELVAAMSSLVTYLDFESENPEMFDKRRLPTLDTEIWYDEKQNKVKFSFFEKTTCPNRVLQKQTALSETCIRASLTQEVVRRLRNCSTDLPQKEKQEILSVLCQKMIKSGHSVASTQFILVHGVVKYLDMLEKSKLDPSEKDYKPMYCSKEFDLCNRKLRKILAKTSWYD